MSKRFEAVIPLSVAREFLGLRRGLRIRIEEFLEHLCRYPTTRGDYEDPDRKDHVHEVKLIGACMITWWVDHAAREIRVIAVEDVADD